MTNWNYWAALFELYGLFIALLLMAALYLAEHRR